MKRIVLVLLALLLFSLPVSAAESNPSTIARSIPELLSQGETQQVFDQSTADMQAAVGSATGWESVWAQLTQVYGEYHGVQSADMAEQGGFFVINVVCAFTNADITFTVVLTADHLLAGFTVAGVSPKAAESPADTSRFISEPITLRAGQADETQGLLTLPVGDGPFPAVIMMQGSGPSDKNESAYGMMIFRDLAEGLAQAGIVGIRYDKYTYAHADLLSADTTIRQEYLIDAQDALTLLQADPRVGDIYLLGHSLGGILVPRVMQALDPDAFAGGIIISGTPLPLWEIQFHQNLDYIATLEPAEQAPAKAAIEQEAAKLNLLQTMTDEELQNTMFFGISAWYQMDLLSVDTAQTAIALQKPLLITQGGKDWQISPADGMEAWQAALNGLLQADYRLYPNMTHMLSDLAVDPTGTTADYQAGSTVSQALIDDIATWILR